MYKRFSIIMLAVALSSCGTPQQKASALEENKEAKSLLEGIWLDDNTETALLRVKGDTLFYADAATAPVAFKIASFTNSDLCTVQRSLVAQQSTSEIFFLPPRPLKIPSETWSSADALFSPSFLALTSALV